jgi:glyoxylase-like metal-dependent hydrolase (beta-lactamase superfamily II)
MQNPYTIILAPNPSIMTGPGTNTILLGSKASGAIVIDPAVDNAAYLDAVVQEGERRGGIRRILITHGHHDHIDGAAALRERTGALIYAFSREGAPMADEEIADDTTFPTGDDTLRAIHTPGHRFDHLSYFLDKRRTLFAGDIIAGVGTVVIIPPEGNMQDYLDTLKRLQTIDISEIVPAHGPTISDPQAKLAEYIAHRMQREQQVMQALEVLPPGATIPQMVQNIYTDVDPRLHGVAAWSVEAHLLKLEQEGLVERLEEGGWTLVRPTA